MSPKIYRCKCQVCGKEHEIELVFLSASLYLLADDGITNLPARSCGAHSSEEIRSAFDRRMGVYS